LLTISKLLILIALGHKLFSQSLAAALL